MAKRYLIIHMDDKLQVFDAATERKEFLDRVVHYNKKAGRELNADTKARMSKIFDGCVDEVFPKDEVKSTLFGNTTVYIGTYGPDTK